MEFPPGRNLPILCSSRYDDNPAYMTIKGLFCLVSLTAITCWVLTLSICTTVWGNWMQANFVITISRIITPKIKQPIFLSQNTKYLSCLKLISNNFLHVVRANRLSLFFDFVLFIILNRLHNRHVHAVGKLSPKQVTPRRNASFNNHIQGGFR